jgi:flagellar biosynthesis chaperone FliJ
MNQEEVKKETFKKWVSVVGFLAIGLFVSPFIFLSIKGLVGLAIAAMVGFTTIQFIPVFAAMVANAKYRALDAEKVRHIKGVTGAASENPIETLQTLLIAKKKAFSDFKLSVENAVSARDTFKTKVTKFKQKYPERAQEFEQQLVRVTDLVERKKTALRDAQQSLNEGDMKLEEMKAYYEMSKDAIEANRAAGMDTGDAFEKLKMDTACDSVFETMNTAFAQLEIAATLDVESETNGSKNVKNTPVSKTINEVIFETEQKRTKT